MTESRPYSLSGTVLLVSLLLLGIICMTHLIVMLTFLVHARIPVWLFPVAILSVILGCFCFTERLGLAKRTWLTAVCAVLIMLGLALSLSSFYFDLSWDGQWYQQSAVYDLAGNWNPLFKPVATPDGGNHSSVLHFPKSTWYFGAALLRLSGTVETGKAYNLLMLFAAFGVVYTLYRNLGLTAGKSLLLTVLVLLNPVVWSEMVSYLNDGDLYLSLVIYLSATVLWLRNPKLIYLLIAMMAAVCLVNIKFTGLVFFLISAFFLLLYTGIRQRGQIRKFLVTHVSGGLLAVLVFGFNPYVSNMVHRGNPLYPLFGSKAFPGVFAGGNDDNENYETPQNMRGKSLSVRLFYASFSRPGNAPYNWEQGAQLINPLLISTADWSAYHYQETRVSGFGPYFGVSVMLSLAVLPLLLIRKRSRLPILLFISGLCGCLALSRHFWWPRFFPMLWLLPLVALLGCWTIGPVFRNIRLAKVYGWVLLLFIAVNGLIVAVAHMEWETTASVNLRRELDKMKSEHIPVTVDYGAFRRSVEEKLGHWQIVFKPGPLKESDAGVQKLTSVVPGYPNQVLFRKR